MFFLQERSKMNRFVRLLGAGAIALAASAAIAGPLQTQSLSGGPINFTGFIADTLTTPGNFSDTFTFTLPAPSIANGQVITIFDIASAASQQVVFNTVTLTSGLDVYTFTKGTDIVGSTNVTRFSFLADNPVGTSFTVQVDGCAGLCDGSNQTGAIAASYSGTFNITRVIPEPASFALVLAALGGIGITARRRKPAPAA